MAIINGAGHIIERDILDKVKKKAEQWLKDMNTCCNLELHTVHKTQREYDGDIYEFYMVKAICTKCGQKPIFRVLKNELE